MQLQGVIKLIEETKTFDSGFKSRSVIVTTQEQYPQHIKVEFVKDLCDVLNSYNVGDTVKVSINLRGREWVNPQGETVYFNSIQGWKIEKENNEQAPLPQGTTEEEDDDLPF